MRDIIDKTLTNIDDKYIEEAMPDIDNTDGIKRTRKPVWNKVIAIAAVISILIASLTITAAENYTAYKMLYSVNAGVAKKLALVKESCVDNGIEMTVEAVNIDGNTADIYISLRDLTGDRIDETTDLFDSYSIHTTADSMSGCESVSYDEETKTKTFLISIEQDEPIVGERLKFSVSELITGKTETHCKLDITDKLDITKAYVSSTDLPVRGGAGDESLDIDAPHPILKTISGQGFSPVSGACVVGYGFIDNKLHIQTYYENILEYDNHGFVYLVNSQGERIHYDYSISFWDEEGTGSFDDDVFDVSPEEFEDYEVYGEFTTCGTNIKGDWSVSFWIENKQE